MKGWRRSALIQTWCAVLDENAHFRMRKTIKSKQHIRSNSTKIGSIDQTALDLLNGQRIPISASDLAVQLAAVVGKTIGAPDERNAFRHDVSKRLHRLKEKGLVTMEKRGGRLFWAVPLYERSHMNVDETSQS
ncbi:hypothetical protein ABE444_07810 [Brevundimonas pondensis]|uniref:hypothetical protein n=1 Tax=Brevundimonas pondensis TaxID=2774189 RepID=UPI003207C62A